MSTQVQTPQTDECPACESTFKVNQAVKGSFCSTRCFYEYRGQKALNHIARDHTVCGTCGALLKVIDEPPEDWIEEHGSTQRTVLKHGGDLHNVDDLGICLDATNAAERRPTHVDAVIGHETHTENVTEGVDGVDTETGEVKFTRVSCGCGNVDPQEQIDELREIHATRTLLNLYSRLMELYREGGLDQQVDQDAYLEGYRSTKSVPYAVGVGLHA